MEKFPSKKMFRKLEHNKNQLGGGAKMEQTHIRVYESPRPGPELLLIVQDEINFNYALEHMFTYSDYGGVITDRDFFAENLAERLDATYQKSLDGRVLLYCDQNKLTQIGKSINQAMLTPSTGIDLKVNPREIKTLREVA